MIQDNSGYQEFIIAAWLLKEQTIILPTLVNTKVSLLPFIPPIPMRLTKRKLSTFWIWVFIGVRVLEGLDDDILDLLVLKEEEHELKAKLDMEIEYLENLKTLDASKHTMLQN